jgi:hypothetical protein
MITSLLLGPARNIVPNFAIAWTGQERNVMEGATL